ncbi:hypothetical protein [Cytophaga hutchinsonii]|nr:hypothetical protein [Cytophaga hutchinsonii]SFX61299.1 hypothetical protein SAMN04487930_106155 [Cytophaga hutchinsonii ATCC 33406]
MGKEDVLDNINQAILNHLKMKTTGALLLTGAWGSGKTHHLKNRVFPLIETTTEFIPIIVSLYGETDKNNIAQKVIFEYFDKKGKDVHLSTGTIAKNIKNFSEAVPFLKKYVDLDKLIVGAGDNIFRFLPHGNLLICFDDLERMSEKIDINDFLGIVSDLVENKGCKVLLIANESEMKHGITFKEKTIEKTIHFIPKISSIFDSIISSYASSPFKDYLTSNKDFIILTLNPKTDDKDDQNELSKSFSNIRSLKFSIEHFKYPYLLLTKDGKEDSDLINQQLKSLWLFTLSISIEFRKPNNISFTDKKKLDEQATSFLDMDFGLDKTEKKDIIVEENLWSYSENFKRIYYNRLSEKFIFFPVVYDLITSGQEIPNEEFLIHLDESFNIKEGQINPAHQILNTFLHSGYWSYTDEDFRVALNDLLKYCESGKFEDIISYINACFYLLTFYEIIDVQKDDIIIKVEKGLDIFLPQTKLNYLIKSQLEIVQEDLNDPLLQKLILHIQQKIVKIEIYNALIEAEELEKLFANDLQLFIKEFLPANTNVRSPSTPLFHQFKKKTIDESVKKWQPKEIMDLASFLSIRYLETSYSDRLTKELIFLENIESAITIKGLTEKTLSNDVLKKNLLPRITKCKSILQSHISKNSK